MIPRPATTTSRRDLGAYADGTCEVYAAGGAFWLEIFFDSVVDVDALTKAVIPDSIDAAGVAGEGSGRLLVEEPVGTLDNVSDVSITLVAVQGDADVIRRTPPNAGRPRAGPLCFLAGQR